MTLDRDVYVTYLGHATFLITTPGGKSLLIDPWLQNNPACPDQHKKIDSLDTMLLTHAHFDHIQDAVALDRGKASKSVETGALDSPGVGIGV